MSNHSKLAAGILGFAVVLILLGAVFPMAHAAVNLGGISALGLAIIVLLLAALGVVVAGSLKRTP